LAIGGEGVAFKLRTTPGKEIRGSVHYFNLFCSPERRGARRRRSRAGPGGSGPPRAHGSTAAARQGNFGRDLGNVGRDLGNVARDLRNVARDLGNVGHDLRNVARDLGNVGRDLGNVGRDLGNVGRDLGNVGRDLGNVGRDSGNVGRLYLLLTTPRSHAAHAVFAARGVCSISVHPHTWTQIII
jgi:hypothetical protein